MGYAKKFVEEGNLGGKGGEVHKATVLVIPLAILLKIPRAPA
jgi:hypothetical protein